MIERVCYIKFGGWKKILKNVININLLVYIYFDNFKLRCDIYYVGSFNDKRIVFWSDMYKEWVC